MDFDEATNRPTVTNQPLTSTSLDNSFDRDFSTIELYESRKKRCVEDLFGDINDIEEEERSSKRPKRDVEADFKLIDRIKQERRLNKTKLTAENEFGRNSRTISREQHIRENLSYRVPRYPFIVVVRHDGERVYVRMHSEEYENEEIKRVAEESICEGFLMGKSFKDVLERAQVYLAKRKDANIVEVTNETVPESDNADMWVDLYKPRRYLELLSDESTNRTLLRWIKLWDKVVFKRRTKTVSKKSAKANVFSFKKNELDETLDEHDRPKYKVALLCGPPGLGKTTLAHMVARHAGTF